MAATYDGIAVFGRSVRIDESENPAAWQFASFFGLDGVFSLFGGTRGRAFVVRGVFAGAAPADVIAQLDALRPTRTGSSAP